MTVFSNRASSTPADIADYVAALLQLLGDQDPVLVLDRTTAELQQFLETVPSTVVASPEAAGQWSIRDVIQHLADSELVGGFRLRMVLAHDRPRLTGYDQDLWADRLKYRDADVHEALEQFAALRRANVRLWRRLSPTDLTRVGLHGERGEESLGLMRRLYAGHDLLHLRQLERIRARLLPTSAETIVIARADLTAEPSRALIRSLNDELSALYPEPGATHFQLDPEEVTGGRGAFLLVYVEGTPVGCGAVRLLDADTAELKRMFVVPTARGTGLGRRLVAALEAEARNLGVRRLVLETGVRQAAALALYRATGFHPIPLYGEYDRSSGTSVCLGKALHLPEDAGTQGEGFS